MTGASGPMTLTFPSTSPGSDAKQKKHVFFNKKPVLKKKKSQKKWFLMCFFKHLLFNARKIHLKYFGVRIYIIYCKFCNIQHKFTGHRL